jgi:hypothetical protein
VIDGDSDAVNQGTNVCINGEWCILTGEAQMYLIVGKGKCQSSNQVGGVFDTASPAECREKCVNDHYETYFALWKDAHNQSQCTCYHDCDDIDDTPNSVVYEILSQHVFDLLEEKDNEIAACISDSDTKDEVILTKESEVTTLTSDLEAEEAEKNKWKNRYEHTKNSYPEAENLYQAEAAIGAENNGQEVGVCSALSGNMKQDNGVSLGAVSFSVDTTGKKMYWVCFEW